LGGYSIDRSLIGGGVGVAVAAGRGTV